MLWPTNWNVLPNFWNAVSCRQLFSTSAGISKRKILGWHLQKSATHQSSLNNTSDPVSEAVSDPARQYDRLGSAKKNIHQNDWISFCPWMNIFLSKCYILIFVSISLQMWVYSDRVLEWFYWLLNRVRTFQYWKSWRKNLPILSFHLNLNQISFHSMYREFMISHFYLDMIWPKKL